MKRKELKEIAKKIAKAERTIADSSDPSAIRKAQDKIMELSGKLLSMEDMIAVDELVQDLLNEKS